MADILNLKQKSDAHLMGDIKNLVAKEHELLVQILEYLKEIETRQLFLASGFSSLFDYMTRELKYSEAAAQRRIQAMRLIRDLPEVEEKIVRGKLSLSVASQLQSFLQKEDRKRREGDKLTSQEKLSLVNQLEGTSARKCEERLSQIAPETRLPKERTKPLTPDKIMVQFLASPDLMKKIQRLKSLTSHQNPEGSLEKAFEKAVDLALERLDPERREARRRKRLAKKPNTQATTFPTSETKSPTRHISPSLRDRVWLRDQGKCQYRDTKTGKECDSKHLVQLDHRYAFALGGEHSEQNLRLRCQKHNLFHAKEVFD